MSDFTCARCLNAPGTLAVPIDDDVTETWCESCLMRCVDDYLLDLVNDGELRVAQGGKSLQPTELFAARWEYEHEDDR